MAVSIRIAHIGYIYSLLGIVVSQPFLVESAGFENSTFWSEMVEQRLDLTSYMSCTNAEVDHGNTRPTAYV